VWRAEGLKSQFGLPCPLIFLTFYPFFSLSALPLTLTNTIGSTTMKLVEIYTDGACSGNPGPGGYGVILKSNGNTRELSQGFKNTTNNRMELRAVIEGLKALKEKCNVLVYSDSKYIVDAVEKGWARRWEANNWYRNKKEKALNIDLWLDLLDLLDKHQVRFRWVKGHAGHPENELCDQMAVAAAAGENLFDDI
jgi:ribonuclease HI